MVTDVTQQMLHPLSIQKSKRATQGNPSVTKDTAVDFGVDPLHLTRSPGGHEGRHVQLQGKGNVSRDLPSQLG